MKLRSFLAFDISDGMKEELSSIISYLSVHVKDVKWIQPSRMHCTIRFFGDVEESLLTGKLSDVIAAEVRHQAPMHLSGKGIGVFPNWRYPRVLWAGLHGDTESIISLHAKLEDAFEDFGFQKDKRDLRLHLTLGRMRPRFRGAGELVRLVEKLGEKEYGDIKVDSFVLYKSELKSDGPIYTALKSFRLGG
jgi:2'-5' RNA ligase